MKKLSILLTFIFAFYEFSIAEGYKIYPIPQNLSVTSNIVNLTPTINVVEESLTSVLKNRIEEVLNSHGFEVEFTASTSADKTNLYIGIYGNGDSADQYFKTKQYSTAIFETNAHQFDPSFMKLDNESSFGNLLILGNDKGSSYYAFASLDQILEQCETSQVHLFTLQDFSYTQYRGIVEGFYGHPWSVENRLSILDYCKRYKLNTYVYGPKSDPYHLGKWADDYPLTVTDHERYMGIITQDDIQKIALKARACHVDFIWASHPGMSNGVSFSSNSTVDQGVTRIMDKFEHLHSLGVRGFGVFLDDMNYTPSGNMAAYLIDQVQKKLREKYNSSEESKVAPLFYVPTQYALNYGTYTLGYLSSIDSEVVVGFTGYDCFSNVRSSSFATMANLIGRNPVMWWNNPVNDDHDDRIYLKELTCHWTIEQQAPVDHMQGLLLNPMNQAQASKIALFGGADYSWNPSRFNVNENWENAILSLTKDVDLQSAIRTFALSSNTLIEPSDLKQLYSDFESALSEGKIAANVDELRIKIKQLHQACIEVSKMKNSNIREDQLFYEDVACWVEKLKSMTSIIEQCLEICSETDCNWLDYLNVQKEYAKIHTDSTYWVSALEESGTNAYERYIEVKPSDTDMMPFINRIVNKIGDFSTFEIPNTDTLLIISNRTTVENLNLQISSINASLSGLSQITLAPNEYVGVYINAYKQVSEEFSDLEESKSLVLEYSINGKEWFPFDNEELPALAYFRIRNISSNSTLIPIDELRLSFATTYQGTPSVSTNMNQYSTYPISNVIDKDESTFFWKGSPQAADDYIRLDYQEEVCFNQVELVFTSNDYLYGNAIIQVSKDGDTWKTVASMSSSDIKNNKIICSANAENGRYLQFVITSVTQNYWFQMAEFNVSLLGGNKSLALDQDQNPVYGLDDKSLKTAYTAQKEGSVTYQFRNYLDIQSIDIYQYSQFDNRYELPFIEIEDKNGWHERGFLSDSYSSISVLDLVDVKAIRISWNSYNIPSICEFVAKGIPYQDNLITRLDSSTDDNLLRFVREDDFFYVYSTKGILQMSVYRLDGTIAFFQEGNTLYKIPFQSTPQIMIINVVLNDGSVLRRKISL